MLSSGCEVAERLPFTGMFFAESFTDRSRAGHSFITVFQFDRVVTGHEFYPKDYCGLGLCSSCR